MFAGSLWTVSMRWSMKLIGFANTAILARMILPSEYAVVAMAYLVVGLMESFFDFGVEAALMRKSEISEEFINSAWSLRIVEGAGIAVLLLLISPLVTIYFHDPRIAPVLWVLAGCFAIGSSSNIGLMLARKNLNFSLEFRLQVISKVLQVISTLTAAYFLRDYRALVIGIIVGYASSWILSFLMHPYRPTWNTSGFLEIWQVTRWLMLSNIARFLVRKADEITAGRIGTSSQFGMYNVGADLGMLPTGEVGPAILKAFFPVLSSIQHDAERVRSGVLKVLSIVNAITLPAGIGLAAVAAPATLLMLGPNWGGAVQFVAIFGVIGAIQVASNPLSTLLTMRGFTKIQSRIVWTEFAVFAVASLILVPTLHLRGLAFARLAGAFSSAIFIAYECAETCDLPLKAMVAAIWRPLTSSVIMYFVASWAVTFFTNLYAGMAFAITLGAISYIVLMMASWHFFARPPGLESEVVAFIRRTPK